MLVIAAQLRGLKSAADIAGNERRLTCRECSRFCQGVSNPEQVPTGIEMAISVVNIAAEAAPALAGIPFGWEQCFDKLAALLAGRDNAE